MQNSGGNRNSSGLRLGLHKIRVGPQVTADESDDIRKGGFGFGVPGGRADGQRALGSELVSQQGDERKQAQEGGGGAGNCQIRPLALGFHP